MRDTFGLGSKNFKLLKSLNTPIKIQNFLDRIPVNYEKNGETIMSPSRALKARKLHCIEGAMIAALALWINGEEPLLMDLRSQSPDVDHVVALYRRNGRWGAISKTNHATIRFRDPVYKTLRELALSYFHEWFMNDNGKKTMRDYGTKPLNLKKFGKSWITHEEDLDHIADALDQLPHEDIVPKANRRYLRRADKMELKAGRLTEWSKSDPRT